MLELNNLVLININHISGIKHTRPFRSLIILLGMQMQIRDEWNSTGNKITFWFEIYKDYFLLWVLNMADLM